jgi:hypothetical protein
VPVQLSRRDGLEFDQHVRGAEHLIRRQNKDLRADCLHHLPSDVPRIVAIPP